MYPPLRDGYKLAKIVKDDTFCPELANKGLRAKGFITSYILKTITFMMYMNARDKIIHLSSSRKIDIAEVVCWTKAIYKILTYALQKCHLESIYIPGYNLLGDAKYFQFRETAVQYAKGLENILATDKPNNMSALIETTTSACLEMIEEKIHIVSFFGAIPVR